MVNGSFNNLIQAYENYRKITKYKSNVMMLKTGIPKGKTGHI